MASVPCGLLSGLQNCLTSWKLRPALPPTTPPRTPWALLARTTCFSLCLCEQVRTVPSTQNALPGYLSSSPEGRLNQITPVRTFCTPVGLFLPPFLKNRVPPDLWGRVLLVLQAQREGRPFRPRTHLCPPSRLCLPVSLLPPALPTPTLRHG